MVNRHEKMIPTRGIRMKKAASLLHEMQQLDALTEERGGSQIKFLLYVAAKHPQPVLLRDIEEQLELTQGQVSRIARTFHSVNSEGQPGLNLIDIKFDLYSPRTKLISLNDKGLAALKNAIN